MTRREPVKQTLQTDTFVEIIARSYLPWRLGVGGRRCRLWCSVPPGLTDCRLAGGGTGRRLGRGPQAAAAGSADAVKLMPAGEPYLSEKRHRADVYKLTWRNAVPLQGQSVSLAQAAGGHDAPPSGAPLTPNQAAAAVGCKLPGRRLQSCGSAKVLERGGLGGFGGSGVERVRGQACWSGLHLVNV